MCCPEATSRCQSDRHSNMLARNFLSASTFSIQASRAFSSSGTKNDDNRDRTLSKLAASDVMWSDKLKCQGSIRNDVELRRTFEYPHYRNCDDYEKIVALQKKGVP